MKLYPIETGNLKLDGGAMFGVVPKVMWKKAYPADENNLCNWSMRCLLVIDGDRKILIDNGIGDKQDEKFLKHYYLNGDDSLEKSLEKAGYTADDITDMVLTHLHFDHCGGGIQWNQNKTGYEVAFKNASFWSNQDHWRWATTPNKREKASFLKENINPIEESGQLNYVSLPEKDYLINSELGFDILFADGHTDKQMIPHIKYQGKTLVFAADLLPTTGHIPLPYVMGYDTRPLMTMNEKAEFLEKAADNDYFIFLEHDANHQLCTVKHTIKGVRLDKTYNFNEVFQ